MPAAALGLGAAIGGAGVSSAVGGGFLGAVLGGGTAFGISFLGSELLGLNEESSDLTANLNRGVTINLVDNTGFVPVIYGTVRVGGLVVCKATDQGTTKYLNSIQVWCEGEIDGFDDFFLDDRDTDDSFFDDTIRNLNSRDGTDSQTVIGSAQSNINGWNSNCVVSGFAYSHLRLRWDQEIYVRGDPTFSAIVRGKLVYDPRDQTVKFSDNPSLCIRDYATNSRYGRGLTTVNDQTFIDAANYCDELVSVPDGGGGFTTQKRYTCNGVIDTGQSLHQNMKRLLACCRGHLLKRGSLWELIVERDETPVMDLTEDDIVGGWSFVGQDENEQLNRVWAEHRNRFKSWQNDLSVWDNESIRDSEDDGVLLEQTIGAPMVSEPYQARQLAMATLKQSRFGQRIQLTATSRAIPLEVMDVITITHPFPGYTAIPFRVTEAEPLQNGDVRLSLHEYNASVYTQDPLTDQDVAPTSELPDPNSADPPTGVVATSATIGKGNGTFSTLTVTWTDPADQYVTNVEVEYKKAADVNWTQAADAQLGIQIAEIIDVEDLVTYDVRLRSRNSTGVHSAYTSVVQETIIGSDLSSLLALETPLLNAGFEAGDVDWSGSTYFSIVEDPTNAYAGDWVARMDATTGSTGARFWRNGGRLAVEPGDIVVASGQLKSSASALGDAYVRIQWKDAADADFANVEAVPFTGPQTTYVESRVNGVAPAGVAAAQFQFIVDGEVVNGADWFCDNAVFYLIPKEGATLETSRLYVINPSFEQGDTEWATSPEFSIVEDETNARRGKWVGEHNGVGSTTDSIRNLSGRLPVDPGDRVLAACYAKAESGANGTANVAIQWRRDNDSLLSTSRPTALTASTSYQKSQLIATAPANAASARIIGEVNNETGGKWWFDDFVLELQTGGQFGDTISDEGGVILDDEDMASTVNPIDGNNTDQLMVDGAVSVREFDRGTQDNIQQSYATVETRSITAGGGDVLVYWSASAEVRTGTPDTFTARIRRDGNTLATSLPCTVPGNTGDFYLDTAQNGTKTYTIEMLCNSDSVDAIGTIMLEELKK